MPKLFWRTGREIEEVEDDVPDIPQTNLAAGGPARAPTTIVREDLREGNYADWRACMRQYLVGQGLWEVCEMKCKAPSDKTKDPVAYSQWERKNAKALHAIQISCSQIMFSHIRDMEFANLAWEFLEQNANPTLYFDRKLHGAQLPPATASTENADLAQLYKKLRKALEDGDGGEISKLLRSNEDAVRAKISKSGSTPLHVAAVYGHIGIVQDLVRRLKEEDLELKEDQFGFTPLALVASDGNRNVTAIAKAMIQKNRRLANIADAKNILPVVNACIKGKREMTRFLYLKTAPEQLAPKEGEGLNGATLLSSCIASEFLDIALDVIKKYPLLGVTLDMNGLVPLYVLGQTPALFQNGSQLLFWERWIYSCITANVDPASHLVQVNVVDDTAESQDERNNTEKEIIPEIIDNIYAQKLMHVKTIKLLDDICTGLVENIESDKVMYRVHQAVIQAVKQGNVEFVARMVKNIPELAWERDINGRNIFSIAILYRQPKIFTLLCGLNDGKMVRILSDVDRFGNNLLHLAAMLPPSDKLDNVSDAALLMQRELQWFKEMKSSVPPTLKEVGNSDGKKPSEVFSEQHAGLMKEGEKWMKQLATSNSFVAALIVTITFAAAFTIPGGNSDDGAPIFLHYNPFTIFIVSDSVSLLSATTSVLMFLGILTSQYAENKFRMRQPTKLITGLSTLYISITAMIIAFCAALAILLKESLDKRAIMIPILLLACIPVTLLALTQFSLFVRIFIPTTRPSTKRLNKAKECILILLFRALIIGILLAIIVGLGSIINRIKSYLHGH